MILPNATVSQIRNGTTQYADRRVQLSYASRAQMDDQGGGMFTQVRLQDTPSGGWQEGDICVVTQLDGFSSLPVDTQYAVGLVQYQPGRLPAIDAVLESGVV